MLAWVAACNRISVWRDVIDSATMFRRSSAESFSLNMVSKNSLLCCFSLGVSVLPGKDRRAEFPLVQC